MEDQAHAALQPPSEDVSSDVVTPPGEDHALLVDDSPLDVFNTPLADLQRKVYEEEERVKAELAMKAFLEAQAALPPVDDEGPKEKRKKRKRKQSLGIRASTKKPKDTDSLFEKETPLTSEAESISSSKIDDKTLYGKKSFYSTWSIKAASSPEGSDVRYEVIHIAPVTFPPDLQRALKCEVGVNVFMEQPWTIITKTDVLKSLKEGSPLSEYAEAIKAYPEEEMLVGRASLFNPDDFVIALTVHGRNILLEEIKFKHLEWINTLQKERNHPIGTWESLGSEKEIEEENIQCARPLISYDCTLQRKAHEGRYDRGFTYEEFYVEIKGPIYSATQNVEGKVFDKYTQVGPTYRDVLVETTPEIPVNSSTQFTTEMRVLENEEKLLNMDLDEEVLKQKMTTFLYKVDTLLTYNEEYDLYKDDYEILADAGEELNMYPNIPYDHFLTMVTFIGTRGRGISSTSWHPNKPGVIAVSYAKENIKMIGNLSDNSDDESFAESDSDGEKIFASVPVSNPFGNVVRKLWTSQLIDLEKKLKAERDRNLFKLATTSIKFMKYARDMRLFEMIQAKKQLLNAPDLDDLDNEEHFEYPLFEGTKKKNRQKKIDIDEILQRPPQFLKRDYLFSDSFKWKLQAAKMVDPIYLMIKENKEVPKKYVKTFLFREIWAGDEWNFGEDLEMEAIDINQKFRESGILVLGKPQIPRHKILLPGFANEEYLEPTEEVNPWKEIEEYEKQNSGRIEDKDPSFDLGNVKKSGNTSNYGHLLVQELPQCEIKLLNIDYKKEQSLDTPPEQSQHEITHLKMPFFCDLESSKELTVVRNNNNLKGKENPQDNYFSKPERKEMGGYFKQTNHENEQISGGKVEGENTLEAKEYSGEVGGTEENILDIPHAANFFIENSTWGFQPEDQKSLKEQVRKLLNSERKTLLKRDLEVLSDCSSSEEFFEKDDDEEELDKLELQHYVVIWSIVDDLRPMHRLVSPFEVTSVSFCPYNGQYIVGGLITGQVVLWELEGCTVREIEEIDIENSSDKEGFRHLGRVMSWFKRLHSTERIHVSGLSCKQTSHMDRVINITWLPPNIEILPDKGGRYNLTKSEGTGTLQFMSTSADGTVKYWSLKSTPNPALQAPFSVYSLQRQTTFERPKSLQKRPLKYSHLYLRWDPIFQVKFGIPDPVFTASRFHITCISHDEIPYEYQRKVQKPKFGERRHAMGAEYDMSCLGNINLLSEAIIGSIDGVVAFVSWQQPAEGQPGEHKLVDKDGLAAAVVRKYNYIHDGPITCIARHPSRRNLFLTAGGHVFSLWSIEREEPLKWKKYAELITTFVGWTGFKASTFRVGFSDGTLEIWDLLEDGNEAKMTLAVAEGSICDLTVPTLPVPRGLIAVADQRGVLKFFNIPMDYQVDHPEERDKFFDMIETEKSRKEQMKHLADEWRKEKEKGKKPKGKATAVDAESAASGEQQELEPTVKVKLRDIVGCKKIKEELYKWYLRRRGRTAAWLDPAEKLWYSQEEEHMIKTILKNRRISMKALDIAIRPLQQKEKRESELSVKMDEIVKMADEIFLNAIRDFEIPREYVYKSQVSLEIENIEQDNIQEAMEKVNLYFGESYKEAEKKLEETVRSNQIKKDWSLSELLEKYQGVRDFWNDRRRYLEEDQRRVREIVKEQIEKEGLEFSYWINHEETYLAKKYQRRLENIEELKKMYGSDYDPYWDLKEEGQPRRKHYRDFMEHLEDKTGESKLQVVQVSPKQKVDINLPEGSFYRKYMGDEKLKWKKPKGGEEIFTSPAFKFKYGDSYPVASDEECAQPPEEHKEAAEEIFPWSSPTEVDETPIDEDKSPAEEPINEKEATEIKENDQKKTKKKVERKQKKPVQGQEPDKIPEKLPIKPEDSESQATAGKFDTIKKDDSLELKVLEDKGKEVLSAMKSSSVRFEDKTEYELAREPQQLQRKGSYKKINIAKENLRFASFKALQTAVIEKKAKGEEIPDINDVLGYESCSSVSSLSSAQDSPLMSLGSEDESEEIDILADTEEDFKEYFEGPPPRYEPPKRRPYFRAPQEDEPTEEWVSEDRAEDSAIKPHAAKPPVSDMDK